MNEAPSKPIASSPRHSSIVLAIVMLGTLMGALDSTIVLLAFPTINDKLHSDLSTSLWIILAYLLVLAVATTQMGRIGDIYGRSRIFNLGFVIFTVGSALCGFSTHIYLLIGFRTVQAAGGALLQATSGAIIADYFPRERRGRAYGYNSLGFTAGAMLGIVLGGIITTFLSWQYIFFINIPIGIIAVIAGLKYIKDNEKTSAKLDLAGMGLLGSALVLLSLGLVNFASNGISALNISLAVIGAVLIPIFLLYDRRIKNAMIDFEAFKSRVLRNAIFSALFVSIGYFSVVFLVIMYLQGIRALTPLNASLLLVPGYVAGSFLGPNNGQTLRQVRFKRNRHNGNILLSSCYIDLFNDERNLATLHCAFRFSSLRLRHLHVLPSQQQRCNGKCKNRFLRQHLRLVANCAKYWISRKLRFSNLGCGSLNT